METRDFDYESLSSLSSYCGSSDNEILDSDLASAITVDSQDENSSPETSSGCDHESGITFDSQDGPRGVKRRRLDDSVIGQPGRNRESSNPSTTDTSDGEEAQHDPDSPFISGWFRNLDKGQTTITVTIPDNMIPEDFHGIQTTRTKPHIFWQPPQPGSGEIVFKIGKRWDPTPLEIDLLEELVAQGQGYSCWPLRKLRDAAKDWLKNVRTRSQMMNPVRSTTKHAANNIIWYCFPVIVAYVLACKGPRAREHGLAGEAGKGKVTIHMIAQCLSWLSDSLFSEDFLLEQATKELAGNSRNMAEYLKSWYERCHGLKEMPRFMRHLFCRDQGARAELEEMWEERIGHYSEVCLGDYLVEPTDDPKYRLMRCD
ncbi:hypothetical protein VTJ04DRAFT_2642 [Mycothermus thermophilus]|uniref:uncharacterized protein n=1 Tax=Humicola insolens TaxID=85995 RepID=UPI0037428536